MNNIYSPNQKTDVQSRSSPMGQVRYGAVQVQSSHGFLGGCLKLMMALNLGGFIVLVLLLRIKNLFPPHEQPFVNAVCGYFLIGAAICAVGLFVFGYARFVEKQAVTKALTHNRRYEWHSNYDTSSMSEEDLKKTAEVKKGGSAPPQATGAGLKYFRAASALCLCSLIIWILGIQAYMSEIS